MLVTLKYLAAWTCSTALAAGLVAGCEYLAQPWWVGLSLACAAYLPCLVCGGDEDE